MTRLNDTDVDQALALASPNNAAAGFMHTGQDLAHHAGTAAATQREESELKAALFLAASRPRDELRSQTRLLASCKRPRFAEGAQYKFPRGGSMVKGPSVELAREMARLWGNMRSGHRIVSVDREHVHVKGYCHDLETNNYKEEEAKFARRVQRKRRDETTGDMVTVWVEPDERDLRELVNKQGAVCERNAILRCMPPDLIEEACEACDATIHAAARGEIEKDRDTALRRMALAFADLGVTTAMIKEYLGHDFDAITADELADLRQIYKSISDGNSRREEYFKVQSSQGPAKQGGGGAAPDKGDKPAASRSNDLLNEIKGGGGGKAPAGGEKESPESVQAAADRLNEARAKAGVNQSEVPQEPKPETAAEAVSPSTDSAGGTALFGGGGGGKGDGKARTGGRKL